MMNKIRNVHQTVKPTKPFHQRVDAMTGQDANNAALTFNHVQIIMV